jgi:biopolymer transport protein ExbD
MAILQKMGGNKIFESWSLFLYWSTQIAINQIPMDFNSLDSKLRKIYSAGPDKNMFISASSNLPYSDVVKVTDIP